MEGQTVSLGEIMSGQATASQAVPETQVETPQEVQTQAAPATEEVIEQQQAPVDITTSSVSVADRFKDTPTAEPTEPAKTDFKELVKQHKEDLLKELGLDPFALKIDEHLKKGGSAEDFLKAKAIDYTKVPDAILAKEALKQQYKGLTDDEIETIFVDKYKQDEFATDDEKNRGNIYMKADASLQRQKLIEEQQAYKLPEIPASQAQQEISAEEQAIQLAKMVSDNITYLNTHDPNVKSLNESKSLAVDLGEGVEPFKFKIDDPNVITRAIADVSFLSKLLSDEKGVLNTRLAQKMVMSAINPNYERDLFNYGKAAALKELVASGQNAGLPHTPTAGDRNETLKDAFKGARSVTLGSAFGR